MVALMLVPILGTTALAVDVGYWYYKQRSMQSAADSAALAASRAGDADYEQIAKGTAAEYGYVHGIDSVEIDVWRDDCTPDPAKTDVDPDGTYTCVQIGYSSPLFFSPVVGFQGNQNGKQGVSALAIAGEHAGTPGYCLTALIDTDDEFGIRANGVPEADLGGCDIFSNSDLDCNGGNLGAGDAIAAGNSSDCGVNQISGAPLMKDLYGPEGTNQSQYIPKDEEIEAVCGGSYPQADNQDDVPSSNQISGSYNWSIEPEATKILCGDIQLTGDVTLTGGDTVVVIQNGYLDMNGFTFKTAEGTGATLVFTGSDGYKHYPTSTVNNKGTIDIKAPESGEWDGFAIFQDQALNSDVDIPEAGNAPAYNVTGIIYAPKSKITLKGIINKSGTGYNCTIIVAWTIEVDGTGEIFKEGNLDECPDDWDIPGSVAAHKWLIQ